MLITLKIRKLFFELCRNELEHHAPRKKKYICGNNKPFMTKALPKPITERTRLRNTFLKNPTVANKLAYTKQKNFCVLYIYIYIYIYLYIYIYIYILNIYIYI